MEPDLSKYLLEGDNSMYAGASGLVVAGGHPGRARAGRHRRSPAARSASPA